MACFICLEPGALVYSCIPGTCHNLMGHEQCLLDAYTAGTTHCVICKQPYPVSAVSTNSTHCVKPPIAGTMRIIMSILFLLVPLVVVVGSLLLINMPPDGVALCCCVIFVMVALVGVQLRMLCDLCVQRRTTLTGVAWKNREP